LKINFFTYLLFFFSLYSFAGWILETVYASIEAKRFINRGFLRGPFCPIYGFGSLAVICSSAAMDSFVETSAYSQVAKIIAAIMIATILEYCTGFVLEKLFNCKWWDYSDEFLNIQGKVCLKYSILWGFLAYILIEIIHPPVFGFSASLPQAVRFIAGFIATAYLIIDTIITTGDILDLKRIIQDYYKNPLEKSIAAFARYKRIFMAFPQLYFINSDKLNHEIRGYIYDKTAKIKTQIKKWHA